jgi:hypothetical protein
MGDVVIFTNALIAVGTGTASADRVISGRCRSLSWNEEFEDHDVTTFGSTNRVHALGLGDASIDIELMQSYSSADGEENIDVLVGTLRDLSASGRKFLFRFRPVNSSRGATNPEYSMLAIQANRTIVDGEVATPLVNTLSFMSAGDITRATATT